MLIQKSDFLRHGIANSPLPPKSLDEAFRVYLNPDEPGRVLCSYPQLESVLSPTDRLRLWLGSRYARIFIGRRRRGFIALIPGPITAVVTESVSANLVQDIRRGLAIRNAIQLNDSENFG
jgi:hypothetical protein